MKFDFQTFLRNVKEYEIRKKFDPNELAKNFLQGFLILVPITVTIAVVVFVFQSVGALVPILPKYVGFVIVVGFILLVGRLASNVFVRGALRSMENVLTKTPFVKLLYTSIKDLIEAFVGEKKRFDQPVVVSLLQGGHAEAFGFVTRRSMEAFGLEDRVAVYLPQSYNFAGQVLLFHRDQVRPLNAESAEVMTFIVSGGVSGGLSGQPQPEAEARA